MSLQSPEVAFSDHDLEVIQDALFTQEKILAVQSRAGGNAAKMRLNDLQGLLRRMRRQRSGKSALTVGFWGIFSRNRTCGSNS